MDLWNLKAGFYRLRELPPFRWFLDREKRDLIELLKNIELDRTPVLDVGTGTGSSLDLFAKDAHLLALDRSWQMLRKAGGTGRLLKTVADVLDLPLKKNCFAMVTAIGLMEYMQHPDLVLKEVQRVLRPDGRLLITISPPCALNFLRFLLGHRLLLHKPADWEALLRQNQFMVVDQKRSAMQFQYLCIYHSRLKHDVN